MLSAIQQLSTSVGSLANTFGFSLEEFVAALLPPYLERHHQITDLTLARYFSEPEDGWMDEIDLYGVGRRHDRPVSVLAEVRTTLGGGQMRKLSAKLKKMGANLDEADIFLAVVAMNVHPTAQTVGKEEGIAIIPYSAINRPQNFER